MFCADPPEVVEASRDTRESYDLLGQRLVDCCHLDEDDEVAFKDFRQIADQWFEYMGLHKPTANRLGRMLWCKKVGIFAAKQASTLGGNSGVTTA